MSSTVSAKPSSPVEIIVERIRALGLKQLDVARRAGFSGGYLSMILNGERKASLPILDKLSHALEFEDEELLRKLHNDYEAWLKTREGKKHQLVNLVREGRSSSSSGILCDWQIRQFIEKEILGIEPFLPDSIQPASLDLHRGRCTRLQSSGEYPIIKSEDPLLISPGESVIIHTVEKVSMPPFLVGRAAAPGELLVNGIQVAFGLHLDPGFRGHAFALVTNHGCDAYELMPEERFLSCEFHLIAREPERDFAAVRPGFTS